MQSPNRAPSWMKTTLWIAGAYNLAWGTFAILFPNALFRWVGIESPRYPELWQCIGMIVGVYGVGYCLAARDPFIHWPIVLVGLLGKVFGPIGFAIAIFRGTLPALMGVTIVTNDLIWWLPFAAILWGAFRYHNRPEEIGETTSADQSSAISSLLGDNGRSLAEMSEDRSVMVVFLRHAGCTFHKQALADLQHAQKQLEGYGVEVAVVHMARGANPCEQDPRYGLSAVHFSDPQCRLYREFGLRRGSFGQLLGPRVLYMGLLAFTQGHGLGSLMGDSFQMPGVFLVKDGRVIHQYRHRTAGDRPNYVEFARQGAA